MFLQEIPSQPSYKNKKENSNNFFVLNAPKFPGISHFNSLQWLYGYPKYGRDGCLLFQPF
ncbi:hypothetical protein YC2023_117511 [Brassica napus]